MEKVFASYFDAGLYYEQLYSKHCKTNYMGRPTKRYLKLMQKISELEKHSTCGIEMLIIKGV
tara:strand:+ start:863 stop:1048 length:186 start_codon:yes stop_codon:yes gene_type:complete